MLTQVTQTRISVERRSIFEKKLTNVASLKTKTTQLCTLVLHKNVIDQHLLLIARCTSSKHCSWKKIRSTLLLR